MVIIEDKLGTVRYNANVVSHIILDAAACGACTHRVCTTVCPAGCYTLSDESEVLLSYTGCLECGTCRVMCAHLRWDYPLGGHGVSYRFT